jgi:hypothetical protein
MIISKHIFNTCPIVYVSQIKASSVKLNKNKVEDITFKKINVGHLTLEL